ncbi:MAG: addiction module protein [Planctomycetota bacterium]|nr:addiction module protein [Planctomycetota bacterium]
MPDNYKSVLDSALNLSPQDRGQLAAVLIESLDSAADESWLEEWTQEIQRRLEEYDSGQVAGIPWETARRLIQGANP